jgi:hypothetical protein
VRGPAHFGPFSPLFTQRLRETVCKFHMNLQTGALRAPLNIKTMSPCVGVVGHPQTSLVKLSGCFPETGSLGSWVDKGKEKGQGI